MSEDLVQWLGFQLDEDERIAKEAVLFVDPAWRLDRVRNVGLCVGLDSSGAQQEKPITADMWRYPMVGSPALVPHVVEHDPARVLREIEADRALVAAYAESWQACADIANANFRAPDGSLLVERWKEHDAVVQTLKPHVLRRAAVFADRPGYRDDWRP